MKKEKVEKKLTGKQKIEKEINEYDELYRSRTIDAKTYLRSIIPLLDEYCKCKDLTLKEKTKLTALRTALKGLKFIFL